MSFPPPGPFGGAAFPGALVGLGDRLGALLSALAWLGETGILAGAAAAAAAWIAWQAHRRERRRRREREAATDARIEALAFTLNRRVALWTWEREGDEDRLTATQAVEDAEPLMARMEDLMALAPAASPQKARLVTEAAGSFYRAVGALRVVSLGGTAVAFGVVQKPGEEVPGPGWIWDRAERMRGEAKRKLHAAAGRLEDPERDDVMVKVPVE